jgi:hypothetical protein
MRVTFLSTIVMTSALAFEIKSGTGSALLGFEFNVKGVSPLAAPADASYFCRDKSNQKRFSRNGARPAAGFPAMLGASGVR